MRRRPAAEEVLAATIDDGLRRQRGVALERFANVDGQPRDDVQHMTPPNTQPDRYPGRKRVEALARRPLAAANVRRTPVERVAATGRAIPWRGVDSRSSLT